MDIQQMLDKVFLNERDESIPEFERLRKIYDDMTQGGTKCSGCRLKRVKNAIKIELEKLLRQTALPRPRP